MWSFLLFTIGFKEVEFKNIIKSLWGILQLEFPWAMSLMFCLNMIFRILEKNMDHNFAFLVFLLDISTLPFNLILVIWGGWCLIMAFVYFCVNFIFITIIILVPFNRNKRPFLLFIHFVHILILWIRIDINCILWLALVPYDLFFLMAIFWTYIYFYYILFQFLKLYKLWYWLWNQMWIMWDYGRYCWKHLKMRQIKS